MWANKNGRSPRGKNLHGRAAGRGCSRLSKRLSPPPPPHSLACDCCTGAHPLYSQATFAGRWEPGSVVWASCRRADQRSRGSGGFTGAAEALLDAVMCGGVRAGPARAWRLYPVHHPHPGRGAGTACGAVSLDAAPLPAPFPLCLPCTQLARKLPHSLMQDLMQRRCYKYILQPTLYSLLSNRPAKHGLRELSSTYCNEIHPAVTMQ